MNCWFVLNTTRPTFISTASYNSEGNVEEQAISIGSIADVANAVQDQNAGIRSSPGLEVITFSPDKKHNLLRKNTILLIF